LQLRRNNRRVAGLYDHLRGHDDGRPDRRAAHAQSVVAVRLARPVQQAVQRGKIAKEIK